MRARSLVVVLVPTLLVTLACGLGKGDIDYGSCPEYIACSEATGTPTATLEAQYGEDGLCWDGDEDEQVLCRAACDDALEVLATSFPDESACAGSGGVRETAWGIDTECNSTIEETGTREGDISPDFELADQNGDTVHLYDFCSQAVLLMAGTAWDSATLGYVEHIRYFHEEYGEAGLAVIVLLGENEEQQDPTTQDLADFSDFMGFDIPVLADPGFGATEQYGSVSELPRFVLLTDGAEIFELDNRAAGDQNTVEDALP